MNGEGEKGEGEERGRGNEWNKESAEGRHDGEHFSKTGRVQEENRLPNARRRKTPTARPCCSATTTYWSDTQTACFRGYSAPPSATPWPSASTFIPTPYRPTSHAEPRSPSQLPKG